MPVFQDIGTAVGDLFGGKKRRARKFSGGGQDREVVTIEGVDYAVPAGFDTSILERELAAEEAIRSGLEGQVAAAGEAVTDVQRQEEASVEALRRGAAQALATQRGLVEGGRGLSLARGTAEQAATKEKLFRSQFASQLADARQKAALARTEAAVEEGKLVEAEKARAGKSQEARSRISDIYSKYEGFVYTSSKDFAKMAKDLEAMAASETNPQAAQMYAAAARKARAGNDPRL